MSRKRKPSPSESIFEETLISPAGSAVAELPPSQMSPVAEKSPAPAAPIEKQQPAVPEYSEWDRVAHVWDWFAVYFWIGCVGLIWLLQFVDLFRIPFAQ